MLYFFGFLRSNQSLLFTSSLVFLTHVPVQGQRRCLWLIRPVTCITSGSFSSLYPSCTTGPWSLRGTDQVRCLISMIIRKRNESCFYNMTVHTLKPSSGWKLAKWFIWQSNAVCWIKFKNSSLSLLLNSLIMQQSKKNDILVIENILSWFSNSSYNYLFDY